MPEQDFKVSVVGIVNETETERVIEAGLDNVSKNISSKKKGIKIQAFDIDQLNRDGIKYIQGVEKVKSRIKDLYREAGDKINIKGIKDINGETVKYMATVTKANQIVAQFNLEKAKIGDGFGFVQTGGGFTDKSLGSELTKQVNTLNKYKADVEKILNDYVRVNGSRLLGNGSHFNTIKDSAVNIIQNINNLSKTAGANTDQQMDGIKKVVDALKLEADEYYRIEKNQKKLIDSQTKEVSAVQDKITGLRDKYLEKTGNNQLFDIENVQKTNDEIKKLTGKISELRANTGRSSYNFDANLDVLNNMYNTLEKNVKGYYKLETEQRKTSELYQKQDKDLQMYLLDIQKIKDNTLSPNGRNKLLDENNIKTVSGELNKVENILNAILKGHEKGDIIPKKVFDDIDVRLAKINSNISSFSNQDAAAKNVQSQLDSLNRVEQKVKDLKITYQDTFTKKGSIAAFEMGLEDIYAELERLKGKAGEVRQEEMTGLNNLVTNLKRTASMLSDNEKQQQKTTDEYKKQKYHLDLLRMAIDQISNSALKGKNPLVNTENISDAQKEIKGLSSFVEKLYKSHKQGNIIPTEQFDKFDLKIRKATQSLKNMKDEEVLEKQRAIEIEKTTEAYNKQATTIAELELKIEKIRETDLNAKGGKNLIDEKNIKIVEDRLLHIDSIMAGIYTGYNRGKIIDPDIFRQVEFEVKALNQEIGVMKNEESTAAKNAAQIKSEAEKNTAEYKKQTKQISELESRLQSLRDKAYVGKGKLTDPFNIEETRKGILEVTDLINNLKTNRGKNTVLNQEELDAVDIKLKQIGGDISVFKEMESLVKQEQASVESQNKSLNALSQRLNDIRSKYTRGSNQLFDLKNIRDFEFLVQKAEEEIVRLKGKAGSITSDEATAITNRLSNLQDMASKRLEIEKSERKNLSDAEKTAQAYEKQKFNLSSLRQEVSKISDSAFNGKNPLINEENISSAEKKVKSLNTFIDNLYKEHNKGNILPDDAFTRFDLKIKEISQDLKNMKDDESLQKSLAGSIENQTDALNKYDQKLKDIKAQYSSGSSKLFNSDNVKTFNVEVLKIENELDRLSQKTGYITAEESRILSNMFSELRRTASGYLELEKAERKERSESEKNAKAYSDQIASQTNKLAKLKQSVRSIVDADLKGSKALIDPENINYVEGKLKDINTFIEGMYSGHTRGKLIPDNVFDKVEIKLKDLRQDISVFKDEEAFVKQATKSIESQLTTLNSYEEKIKNLRGTYLMLNGSKQLMDTNNINEVQNALGQLRSHIESLRMTTATNNEQTYRELLNEYNAVIRLADGYSAAEKAATIEERNKQSQLNTVVGLYQQLDKLQAQYLGQGGSSKLFDVNNVDDVTSRLTNLYNMLGTFKATAGNITDAEMRHYKELAGDLQILAQRYYNLEKAASTEEKSLLTQKYTIEDYARVLRKINETTLNPNSSKALVDPNNIANVKMQYDDLEKIILRIQSDNVNGKIIPQEQLNEANSKIKDLTQNIEILRGEEHKTFDADTSQARMLLDIGLQAEKLKTFILSLQQSNLYTGTLKQEVDALAISLANIKTPKELDHLKNTFATVQEKAKQAGLTMKSSIMSEELAQKIKIFSAQVTGYMNQNTKAAQMFGYQFQNIKNGINSITRDSDLTRLQNEFKLLQQNINNAGKTGMTFGERISGAVKKFLMWTGMTNTVMYLVRSIRQMITHTKELDSAMTFLKRVTDETDIAYNRMFDNAIRKAKDLSSSVKDIINSTAEFAKLGFNSKEAEKLAEATTVYARVGQLDINDATESIVSTLSGFKDLNTDDIWKIVDEFDNIGNKFAISSGGIGEALKRSAASLSESNNSLEESIALITTANSVVNLCHLAIVI